MLKLFKPAGYLFIIILLGFAMRTYQLSTNPPALNWDYVSFGYNAYSILKTGADEYGVRYPLVFRAYDVYNLPLLIYAMVPFVAVFGLTEIGIRAPAVAFGLLSILITYLLTIQLTRRKKLALTAALFLAISPWHTQYSREASISILYVLLISIGTLLFLYARNNQKFLPCSLFAFALSFYTYHSALVAGSLLLFFLFILYGRSLTNPRWLSIALFAFFISLLPLGLTIYAGTATNRFNSVSIFQPDVILPDSIERISYDKNRSLSFLTPIHNRRLIYAQTFLRNYFAHWQFDYLFFDGMQNRMFRIPNTGLLYIWDISFLLVGISLLLKQLRSSQARLLLGWFLIAPIPAALSLGAPSSLRAVLYLPVLQIITALGFFRIMHLLKKFPCAKLTRILIVAALSLNFFAFTHTLYIHTPIETAEAWNYSVKQAVQLLPTYEPQFKQIIFTNHYKQPYMYYLFYNRVDPSWFQANWYPGEIMRSTRTVGRITYRKVVWEQDKFLLNALIVGTPEEIPAEASIIHTIRSLNGKPTLLFAKPVSEIEKIASISSR